MKTIYLAFVVFFLSFQASAKVLVVSDIDDTLKVTHVLSKGGQFTSVFDNNSRFVGMAELFRLIDQSYEDVEFHYVSLAPRFLMEAQHQAFLQNNGFPVDGLYTNPGIKQDPNLKQKVIRKLMSSLQPELVIYFGDNGQFDTAVYDQMSREFPQIPSVTYIREAYSSSGKIPYPTRPGQVSFVTSLELSLDLISRGLIPESTYLPMESLVYERMLRDDGHERFGEMVFPWWLDCRDMTWPWEMESPTAKYEYIRGAVLARCGVQ